MNIIPDLNAPPIDPSIFKFPGSVLETSSSQPPPASFGIPSSIDGLDPCTSAFSIGDGIDSVSS